MHLGFLVLTDTKSELLPYSIIINEINVSNTICSAFYRRREYVMKKNIILILMSIVLIMIASSCTKVIRPGTIPLCNVLGKSYFTNDPTEFVDNIEDSYQYYGTIYILDKEDFSQSLSTNYEEYMNKEIYVNKNDNTFIYMKYEDNKYQKLYYETESRNK